MLYEAQIHFFKLVGWTIPMEDRAIMRVLLILALIAFSILAASIIVPYYLTRNDDPNKSIIDNIDDTCNAMEDYQDYINVLTRSRDNSLSSYPIEGPNLELPKQFQDPNSDYIVKITGYENRWSVSSFHESFNHDAIKYISYANWYILISCGPSKEYSYTMIKKIISNKNSITSASLNTLALPYIYDPTNGICSKGNIILSSHQLGLNNIPSIREWIDNYSCKKHR
jgi:hypothetical protein